MGTFYCPMRNEEDESQKGDHLAKVPADTWQHWGLNQGLLGSRTPPNPPLSTDTTHNSSPTECSRFSSLRAPRLGRCPQDHQLPQGHAWPWLHHILNLFHMWTSNSTCGLLSQTQSYTCLKCQYIVKWKSTCRTMFIMIPLSFNKRELCSFNQQRIATLHI